MKKTNLVIICLTSALLIFSNKLTETLDIEREINCGNSMFYNSERGEIYIEHEIIIDSKIKIEKISFSIDTQIADTYNKTKYNNYDYNLENGNKILNKSPKSNVSFEGAGFSSNSTHIRFQIFPFITSDSIIKKAGKVEITVEYSELTEKTMKSPFDELFTNKSKESDIQRYECKSLENSATLDMLVITSNEFKNDLEDYALFQGLLGIKTEIASVESILSVSRGADTQEKIRNFIKECYSTKGIRFLLLAGDTRIVPIRMSFSTISYYYGDVPTDLYYSDIDGDWNGDNDENIGEIPSDIADGVPDIITSRIPFENKAELDNIMAKLHGYIFDNDPQSLNKVLYAGASLVSNLLDGSGQMLSLSVISLTNMLKYNNKTLFAPLVDPANNPPLYSGDEQLNAVSFINNISSGYHFINHIDHSTEFYLGTGNIQTKTEYNSQDTSKLSNQKNVYSVMFTMGCSANGIDREAVSEGLLSSLNSSIINYTGFTRTGWTSSEGLMRRFWTKMTDSSTVYAGEAWISALMDNNIYFRIALNMTGFAGMPVYMEKNDSIFAVIPDSADISDSIIISAQDKNGALTNALVIITDKNEYVRLYTNSQGMVSYPYSRFDKTVYVGISKKDHIPLIDTIIISSSFPAEAVFAKIDSIDRKFLRIELANKCDTSVIVSSIAVKGADSLFSISRTVENVGIAAHETIMEIFDFDFSKPPVFDIRKEMNITIIADGISKEDSFSVEFEKDSFCVSSINISAKNTHNIDSIKIRKDSKLNAENVDVKITSTTAGITVMDSFISINLFEEEIFTIRDIKIRITDNSLEAKDGIYRIIIKSEGKTDTIDANGEARMITSSLFGAVGSEGIKIYHFIEGFKSYIYKSSNYNGPFTLIDSMNPDENMFIDYSYDLGNIYYYAVFFDNLGREVSRTYITKVEAYAKVTKSDVQASGSYYGALDGKRYYARSSFNSYDLDNDGYKEILFVSDDGRVHILNKELKDITPFSLFTNPHQETTPAIGDIDKDGHFDIVISNGYQSSDTTAFIIFNPFSSNIRISAVRGCGISMSSPVIANIDNDGLNEILLGTSTGIYCIKADLSLVANLKKTIANVVGIAVSEDKSVIFANDLYGNIYSFDFSGNSRSGFPVKVAHVTMAPIILTDIDNDTRLDIVVGTTGGYLYVINEYGVIRSGFPYPALSGIYHTPRIFDINGDYNAEMVFSDIAGNVYVIDNAGVRQSYYYTGEGTNTYNEIVIYDFNGDAKQDFVFLTRSGSLLVFNQNLTLIYSNLVKFNEIITSCPIVVDFNGTGSPVLIARDYAGNIYKVASYSSLKNLNKISFSKTLYDTKNTSYINGFILYLSDAKKIEIDKKEKKSIIISNIFGNSNLRISYNLYESEILLDIYNEIGQSVVRAKLDHNIGFYEKDLSKLSAGEYFVVASNNNEVISKKKINILK